MSAKPKIKAKPVLRILFGLFALVMAICLFGLGAHENNKRGLWQQYQERYKQQYAQRLRDELNRQADELPKNDAQRLTQMLGVAEAMPVKMNAIFLPGASSRDLCMTCHTAMENPMFKDDPHPLKKHPDQILKHHTIANFGCTLCHHGQGVGLTPEKAHGFEENWEQPRLPLKYIQSTCFECHENVTELKGAETAVAGKSLFVEKGCYGCHDAAVRTDLPKYSTPFNAISKKIRRKSWALKWIENPAGVRPTTLMPKFRLSKSQRRDLVAWIFSLEDQTVHLGLSDNQKGSAKKGQALFNEKACAACHSEKADEPGLTRRVPMLFDAGLKLKGDWLINWISDPMAINPDTWMPKLELTPKNVRHLAAYVKTLVPGDDGGPPAEPATEGDKDRGKKLAQSLGCLGCHIVRGETDPAKIGVSVTDVADKRMEELPFGNSEVAHTKWDWIHNKINTPSVYQTEDMPMTMPDYQLTGEEVDKLTVFYLFNRLADLPEKYLVRESREQALREKGEWMLSHYNCRGCHSILPGETPRIDGYLTKKSMVPPRIVDEVEKVQPAWLFNYLNRPFAMRPWLSIRMPEFNIDYEDKIILIRYLHRLMPEEKQRMVSLPYETKIAKSDYSQETLEMGKYRFRNDKCMQCHPVSFSGELPQGQKLEDLSINLMLAKSRLRFEWIKNFLRNPDQYAGSGTKMPFVYYTPDGVPRIPDPEQWIDRTTLFIMFMDKVPKPQKAEEKTRQVETFDFDDY
jgi:mono/diheme cytochrome c family protein